VGSGRRGIALETPDAVFVGPDNGVFTPFLPQRSMCVELTNPDTHLHPVSATFHGRDIFAPVAAHLASGFPVSALGAPVKDPVFLPNRKPQRQPDGSLLAEVRLADRFGNLVTNFRPSEWGVAGDALHDLRVVVSGHTLNVKRTYADEAVDSLLALVGSSGYLEIAVREGSAAERLGLQSGDPVEIWGA
jgi:S-adenosylmethionine hydrolase